MVHALRAQTTGTVTKHWARSLGGRILLPVLGIGLGTALSGEDTSCEGIGCGFGAPLGALGGMLAATIFDAVIAREDDEASDAVMFAVGGGF